MDMNSKHDVDALRTWFATWDKLVDAVDFITARQLFHDDVVGFGTRMDTVRGLDALERMQWRPVWPTIDGFHFVQDMLQAIVSPDRLQATAIVPWTSTGYHENGEAFQRNGRATVVFTRHHVGEDWRSSHTHMSLTPGTPQRSHGSKPERKPA